MPAEAPQSLSSLLQQSTIDDHEEILKACNTALKKRKTDVEAQHAKAIALLKLDRYDDAARFFAEAGSELQARAPLEYAYTLYKTAKLGEAAEIASKLSGSHGARHVEAQALYRAEDFAKVAELYDRLSEKGVPNEGHDLSINKSAVEAQIHWKDPTTFPRRRPGREDLEAFETAYNVACASIATGEFAKAEMLLRRAKVLCQHSDELSAADKAAELLPIKIQQIYVLERLGKIVEAEQIASEVDPDNVFDLSTRQIAYNNVLLVKTDSSNPFIRHKLFNSTPKISTYDRPFTYQSKLLSSNANTVDLQAFKYDGVAAATAKAISLSSSSATSSKTTSLAVLNAAAHARNASGKAALKRILPVLEQRPDDVGLVITIVQLYFLTNNPTSAVNLLESFLSRLEKSTTDDHQDIRFSPGLVATLVALYKMQGRRSDLKEELAKASSYWRHRSKAPQSLLKAAGLALLESGDSNDILAAKEIFKIVKEQNPADKSANAGFVAAIAARSQAEDLSGVEELTSISKLTSGIDIDSLDRSGIPQSSNALALAQQRTSRKRPADGDRPKPKRTRKSRLPKDYEPGKTPDPERWLPLRDRSSYRPKGKKKGRKDGGDRTQGGMVADDVGVKDAGGSKSQSAGTVLGGGGGNKKKKGKGKK